MLYFSLNVWKEWVLEKLLGGYKHGAPLPLKGWLSLSAILIGEISNKSAKGRVTMKLNESTKKSRGQSRGHTEWVQKIFTETACSHSAGTA